MDKINTKSYWTDKPTWCQPWSIILSGSSFIVFIQYLFKLIWLTCLFSVLVVFWWTLFLLIAPSLYQSQIKE